MLQSKRDKGMVVRLYTELGLGLSGNEVKVGGNSPVATDWFRFDETPLDSGYKLKN